MSKLGYKQKGMPMLKSPLNIVGEGTSDAERLAKYKADKEIERAQDRKNADARVDAIKGVFKGTFTRGTSKKESIKKESIKRRTPSESAGKGIYPSTGRNTTGFQFFDHTTLKPKVLDNPPPPPEGVNGGRSFKDAYAKRDMKTYGNLSQSEYTAEAKRQLKGGKVPGSQMRGSSNKSVNAGIKGPNTKEVAKAKSKLSQLKVDPKGQTITAGKVEKKDILDSKASKTTASRIGKSRKDIRKEKRANIKGGMSRQEARLKKTQSKAASAKAKTNRTIKSIDPTKAKSADTDAKQTSAKSTRAKAKRLEKRAERLKGRVNASKVSK